MKFGMREKILGLLLAAAAIWTGGCGSSTSANTVTVTVYPIGATVVAGQQYPFTATVNGATTLTVVWTCSFTLTTTTNGTPTTSKPAPCPTDGSYGTLSDTTKNTITYTAPSLAKFPKQVPVLTLTATADADHKKTGTATIGLDSGIRVAITPSTATVPVGVKPPATQKFTPALYNDPGTDVTFLVTQPCTGSSCTNLTPTPTSPSCSPACGTIDPKTGVFTAPSTLPTNASVTVVVNSNTDTTRYALALITLVSISTNGVSFDGISPTTVPAGGVVQDIHLQARNILNSTQFFFSPPGTPANQGTPIDPSQIFITPITPAYCTASSTVTCDSSIESRVRLNASQLSLPGTAYISAAIPDSANPGQLKLVSHQLNLVSARPGLVAAVPGSIVQGTNTNVTADGGYYGNSASQVKLLFNGNLNVGAGTSRLFVAPVQGIQTQNPGLYPISVQSNAQAPNQPQYLTSTTNIAVQPNFSSFTPAPVSTPLPTTGLSGTNPVPSSIAINSAKGYAVITEQATNSVQLVNLNGGTPDLSVPPVTSSQFSAPTSIAIDDRIQLAGYAGYDLGVMVNSGNNTLSLLALKAGAAPVILPHVVDLTGLVPGGTPPTPFAVGVDPGSHRAVVAYSNTNIGFIVDVNPADTPTCFLSTKTPPCAIASVSLNTGATPQVVLQPEVPYAYVSPGGAGLMSVVDLLQSNTKVSIAASPSGLVRTNNVVVAKTTTPHGINAGTGGTVLLAGNTPDDLNGTFQVPPGSGVIDPYTFQFVQPGTNKDESGGGGTVQYGSPYLTYNITNTVTGMAIDPVSRTLGFADWNATIAQIGFIGTLDQSVSSLTLVANGYNGVPGVGPELGARWVAFDPYTNLFISYNPNFNQISLINPGAPSAINTIGSPYRIVAPVPTGQTGIGSYTPAGGSAVNVYGAMGYDPRTRQVLVANSGSNSLTSISIETPSAPFVPVQLKNLRVTSSTGGVPNAQPVLASGFKAICDPTSSVTTDPTNKTINSCFLQAVQTGSTAATFSIFGKGFSQLTSAQVRFDGSATIGSGPNNKIISSVVSDSQIDVSFIPPAFLTTPHDFAVDVQGSLGGNTVSTNTLELYVVGVTDLTPVCSGAKPEAVAFDDVDSIAIVTNNGCSTGSIAILNMDQTGTKYGGAAYGSVIGKLNVGQGPLGVAVIPRLHLAVVANNTDATASIIDITDPTKPALKVTTNVAVGIAPQGVAIDQDRALALIANSGSSTLSYIDLTVLLKSTPGTPTSVPIATDAQPRGIAIDPNRSIAVVTAVQFPTIAASYGALDVIVLSGSVPVKSSSATVTGITNTPTGIVYDPAVSPALFYATSTGSNAVYAFNPDTSATQQIRVGINPYSIAFNYQTSTMLTVNTGSNTSSIIDSQTFKTRETLAISSQSMFATDTDRANNTVVMVDQNNDRVLFIALPK